MKVIKQSTTLFEQGNELPEGLSGNFVGQAYLNMLVTADNEASLSIGNVTFGPGCRNNWHKHGSNQFLLVIEGRGWYQEDGCIARELHTGDVVVIPPHVKHWHGAAKDSWFTHLAIEANPAGIPAEWLEPVTEDIYSKLA